MCLPPDCLGKPLEKDFEIDRGTFRTVSRSGRRRHHTRSLLGSRRDLIAGKGSLVATSDISICGSLVDNLPAKRGTVSADLWPWARITNQLCRNTNAIFSKALIVGRLETGGTVPFRKTSSVASTWPYSTKCPSLPPSNLSSDGQVSRLRESEISEAWEIATMPSPAPTEVVKKLLENILNPETARGFVAPDAT